MLKNERQDKILEILSHKKYVTVSELVNSLHYSPATVRRDLTVLEGIGVLRKSYGGVSINTQTPPVVIREHDNTSTKIKLCRAAASLIKEGDLVFIDGTTTTYFLCEFIDKIKNVTVVTSNMKLAMQLCEKNVTCYVTGGLVFDTSMLSSSYAADFLEKMNFDIAFLSVGAVSDDGNYFVAPAFTELWRTALARTKTSVMLFDESKTKKQHKKYYKNIKSFDYVISNAKIPKDWKTKFPDTSFINVN